MAGTKDNGKIETPPQSKATKGSTTQKVDPVAKSLDKLTKSLDKQSADEEKRVQKIDDLIKSINTLRQDYTKALTGGAKPFPNTTAAINEKKIQKLELEMENMRAKQEMTRKKDELTIKKAEASLQTTAQKEQINLEKAALSLIDYKKQLEKRQRTEYLDSYKESAPYKVISAVKSTTGGPGWSTAVSALTGGMINPAVANALGIDKVFKAGVSGIGKALFRDRSLKPEKERTTSAIDIASGDENKTNKLLTDILSTLKNKSEAKQQEEKKQSNGSGFLKSILGVISKGLLAIIGTTVVAGLLSNIKPAVDAMIENFFGEGLAGQAAKNGAGLLMEAIPGAVGGFIATKSMKGAMIGAAISIGIAEISKFVDRMSKAFNGEENPNKPQGWGIALDIVDGAIKGAMVGAPFGPVGMIAGALVGAGIKSIAIIAENWTSIKKGLGEFADWVGNAVAHPIDTVKKLWNNWFGDDSENSDVGKIEKPIDKPSPDVNIVEKPQQPINKKQLLSSINVNPDTIIPGANEVFYPKGMSKNYSNKVTKNIDPKYFEATKAMAEKYGLDQSALLAQIATESNFNKNAQSYDKYGRPMAYGSTQFIDSTWAQYGQGLDRSSIEGQVEAQARYMSDLTKQFGGDYEKALAAYNAGPGRVKEWVKRAAQNGTTWKEEMQRSANRGDPVYGFQQTVNYVDKITGRMGEMNELAAGYSENNQYRTVTNDLPSIDDINTQQGVNTTNQMADKLEQSIVNNSNTQTEAPIYQNNINVPSNMNVYATGDVARTLLLA